VSITDIITDTELGVVRAAYAAKTDEMALVLSVITLAYPPVDKWLNAMGDVVFTELSQSPAPNLPLIPVDRERCLILLIASRQETLTLAIHIYMGLALGLTVAEVANVLALAGVYSGISAYVRGIRVAEATLGVLKTAAATTSGPLAVAGMLNTTFASSWGG
jgi:hypothetical protein